MQNLLQHFFPFSVVCAWVVATFLSAFLHLLLHLTLGEYFCYCLQRDDIIAEWLDTRRQNDEFKQLEKGASPY